MPHHACRRRAAARAGCARRPRAARTRARARVCASARRHTAREPNAVHARRAGCPGPGNSSAVGGGSTSASPARDVRVPHADAHLRSPAGRRPARPASPRSPAARRARPAPGTSPASRAAAHASPSHTASTTNAPARAAVHAPCTIGRGSPAIRAASTDRCSGLRSPPTRANASIDSGATSSPAATATAGRANRSGPAPARASVEQPPRPGRRAPSPAPVEDAARGPARRARRAARRASCTTCTRRRTAAEPRLLVEEVGVDRSRSCTSRRRNANAVARRVDEDRELGLDLGEHAARATTDARHAAQPRRAVGRVAQLDQPRLDHPVSPGSGGHAGTRPHGVRRVHELGQPRGELGHARAARRARPGERQREVERDAVVRRRRSPRGRRGQRGVARPLGDARPRTDRPGGGTPPSAAAANAARAASPSSSSAAGASVQRPVAQHQRRRHAGVDRDDRVRSRRLDRRRTRAARRPARTSTRSADSVTVSPGTISRHSGFGRVAVARDDALRGAQRRDRAGRLRATASAGHPRDRLGLEARQQRRHRLVRPRRSRRPPPARG